MPFNYTWTLPVLTAFGYRLHFTHKSRLQSSTELPIGLTVCGCAAMACLSCSSLCASSCCALCWLRLNPPHSVPFSFSTFALRPLRWRAACFAVAAMEEGAGGGGESRKLAATPSAIVVKTTASPSPSSSMSRFFIMPATERGSSVGWARRLWAEEREEEEGGLDLGRAPAPVALHHTRKEETVGEWM